MSDHPQWTWEHRHDPGCVPCHTLVAGLVLCRWWDVPDDMPTPPEAHVIAAAPKLLESCEEMHYALDDIQCDMEDGEALGEMVVRAMAAIAKAKNSTKPLDTPAATGKIDVDA